MTKLEFAEMLKEVLREVLNKTTDSFQQPVTCEFAVWAAQFKYLINAIPSEPKYTDELADDYGDNT